MSQEAPPGAVIPLQFSLRLSLELCGCPLYLATELGEEMVLSGGMEHPAERYSLRTFALGVAEQFGAAVPAALLPDLWVSGLAARADLTHKAFSLSFYLTAGQSGGETVLDRILSRLEGGVSLTARDGGCTALLTGIYHVTGDCALSVTCRIDPKDGFLSAEWRSGRGPFRLGDLLSLFDVDPSAVPALLRNICLAPERAVFSYWPGTSALALEITAAGLPAYFLYTPKTGFLSAGAQGREGFSLSVLPLAGTAIPELAQAGVRDLTALYASADTPLPPPGLAQPEVFDFTALGQMAGGFLLYARLDAGSFSLPLRMDFPTQKQLAAADGEGSAPFWLTVNKSVGFFTLSRLGGLLEDDSVTLLLDAEMTLKCLTFSFYELGLTLPILDFKGIRPYIGGFAIRYESGPVVLAGMFYHGTDGSYAGQAIINLKKFSFSLTGAYEDTSAGPALFLYAVLNANIGGPPAFYVTGVALGFGYNRALPLPELSKVRSYALVRAALGENVDPRELAKEFPALPGNTCLAAGVKFTSFGLVEGFALATVSFGVHTQIALLGSLEANLPPMKGGDPIAHLEAAIRVILDLDDDFFLLEAALTPGAYLLSRSCRLTGGVAFELWFGGPHKGDFVFSIGGYPDENHRKPHYPKLDRVGIYWDIAKGLTLRGEAYFALTPAYIAAGGLLSVDYVDGGLHAWLKADAYFEMAWKPFHYAIGLGLSVGVSYTAKINLLFVKVRISISISLSCHLDLWGPEFGGSVYVDFWLFGFTIRFGSRNAPNPPPLNYGEFESSFLPVEGGVRASNAPEPGPLKLSATAGVLEEMADHSLRMASTGVGFALESLFPCSSASLNGVPLDPPAGAVKAVYVLPMGENTAAEAPLTLTLTRFAAGRDTPITLPGLTAGVVTGSFPRALWGRTPGRGGDDLMENQLAGVAFALCDPAPYGVPNAGQGLLFSYLTLPAQAEMGPSEPAPGRLRDIGFRRVLDPSAAALRAGVAAELSRLWGRPLVCNDPEFTGDPDYYLDDEPLLKEEG